MINEKSLLYKKFYKNNSKKWETIDKSLCVNFVKSILSA